MLHHIQCHITPEFTEDGLVLNISSPHEIIRLAFAKTDEGAEEISAWSQAPGITPQDLIIDESWDNSNYPDPQDDDDSDSDAIDIDDGGMGFGAIFLLLLAFI